MLETLGLAADEAKQAVPAMDADGDGRIQLSEWEQGLDPMIRSVIEAKLNDQGKVEGL